VSVFAGRGLVLLRPAGGAAAAGRLLEAVAVAIHGQDADVVGQTIQQCAGQALGPQNLRPVLERQVGGDDGGTAFVALGEGLEQQLRAGGRERDVTQFVDNQQLHCGQL
jgi:hypothetical protein